MAHRSRSGPTGLLERLRHAFFPGPTRPEVGAVGSDPLEKAVGGLGVEPRAAASFGSQDAAHIAKITRRYQTIAKVNARATTRGAAGFDGRRPVSSALGTGPGGRGLPMGASHLREIAAVLAMVLVAGVLSAGLPGVSAAPPGSGSASPAATIEDVAAASHLESPSAVPTDSPTPEVTPTDSPTPAPTPTVAPTKAPVKTVTKKVYGFVTLGDSLTAWPSDNPWSNRLDQNAAYLTLVHNAGVPGDTTAMMLARIDRDVFAYSPSVLFILGGTNDVGHSISISTTIANLKSMIVKAKAKGIKVFLLLVPPTSYLREAASIDALNAQIVHLANVYKVIAIDIHTPLSTSKGVFQPRYTIDGVHFTALGAQLVANTAYYRIKSQGY